MSVGAPYDITDLARAIVYNPCLDELLVRALASLLLDDPSVIVLCLSCSCSFWQTYGVASASAVSLQ